MGDVYKDVEKSWEECTQRHAELQIPLDNIVLFDVNGDFQKKIDKASSLADLGKFLLKKQLRKVFTRQIFGKCKLF